MYYIRRTGDCPYYSGAIFFGYDKAAAGGRGLGVAAALYKYIFQAIVTT